jgi:hypothetical protein
VFALAGVCLLAGVGDLKTILRKKLSAVQRISRHLWRMCFAFFIATGSGLGLTIWPLIISHNPELPRMTGVALALLGAIGLLSLLGLRYPLQMIPLLLFELAWKAIWLVAFALPRWLDGTLNERMRSTVSETSLGIVLLVVIPWRYVYAHYVVKSGD